MVHHDLLVLLLELFIFWPAIRSACSLAPNASSSDTCCYPNDLVSTAGNERNALQDAVYLLRISSQPYSAAVLAAIDVFHSLSAWNDSFRVRMRDHPVQSEIGDPIGKSLRAGVGALMADNITYIAIIGPDTSPEAIPLYQITPIYNIISIAGSLTQNSFDDVATFPLYFGTAYRINAMMRATLALLDALNIISLTTLSLRDVNTLARIAAFEQVFLKIDQNNDSIGDTTITRSIVVDVNSTLAFDAQRIPADEDYVAISFGNNLNLMLCQVYKQNKTPTFLGMELRDIRDLWHTPTNDSRMTCTLDEMRHVLNGSIFVQMINPVYVDPNVDCHDGLKLRDITERIDYHQHINGVENQPLLTYYAYCTYDATWALLTAMYRADGRRRAAERATGRAETSFHTWIKSHNYQTLDYERFSRLLVEELAKTSFMGTAGQAPTHDDTIMLNKSLLKFNTPTGELPHLWRAKRTLEMKQREMEENASVAARAAALWNGLTGGGVALLVVVICTAGIIVWRIRVAIRRAREQDVSWLLDADDIRHAQSAPTRRASLFFSYTSLSHIPADGAANNTSSAASELIAEQRRKTIESQKSTTHATYAGNTLVRIRVLPITAKLALNVSMRPAVLNATLPAANAMKSISNDNLVRFIGICFDYKAVNNDNGLFDQETGPPHVAVFEFFEKGSIRDLLSNTAFNVDWELKYSFMADVVRGIETLHKNSLVHGFLHTDNVLLDGKFTAKITDYSLSGILREGTDTKPLTAEDVVEIEDDGELLKLAFRSPEQIVCGFDWCEDKNSSDIFSVAIVFVEFATREPPRFTQTDAPGTILSYAQVVTAKITNKNTLAIEPMIDSIIKCDKEIKEIIRRCISWNPNERPSASQIQRQLAHVPGAATDSVVESLVKRLQNYAHDLEKVVNERTQALQDEMQRSEQLLLQILPRSVAEELKAGRAVEPETFDFVSVYFSDVVGFTTISAQSTPLQVVDLLNAMYTTLDGVLETRRVYKVETIGDAYMVASGLPERIGDEHALEICLFALQIRRAMQNFRVPGDRDVAIRVRIGLNCGPCVAGVVGVRMPRYCLFGDTVNTASRMESTGEAMKIHTSGVLYDLASTRFPNHFQWSERGELEVKGLGKRLTYWLENWADTPEIIN